MTWSFIGSVCKGDTFKQCSFHSVPHFLWMFTGQYHELWVHFFTTSWKISCFVFCRFELAIRGRVFIGYGTMEFSVSTTFWWMFTRYYFELSIFWKIHLIWLIALCGWLIVTSQICCHCSSYVTKLKCSLWPKFVANLVILFCNFFTAIYRSCHSGCSFHSDALVKSDFR
jgi:hypothetical protein